VLEQTLLEHVLKQNQRAGAEFARACARAESARARARADSARARARARAESDHSTASHPEIAQSSARQLYLKPHSPKICRIGTSGSLVSCDANSTPEKSLLEHVLEQNLLEHVLEQTLLEHVLKQNQRARADSARARTLLEHVR